MLEKIKAMRRAKVEKKFGKVDEKIKSAVHKHESHDHSGKPLTKLKEGGIMSAKKTHPRLDKLKRGGKHGTKVNVIIAPQGGKQPVPVPVPTGGAPLPPRAPMSTPPAGPMGAGAPMPGMKTGGKMTKLPDEPTDEPDTMPDKKKCGGATKRAAGGRMTAGAGSGEGRLQKIKNLPAKLKSPKGI